MLTLCFTLSLTPRFHFAVFLLLLQSSFRLVKSLPVKMEALSYAHLTLHFPSLFLIAQVSTPNLQVTVLLRSRHTICRFTFVSFCCRCSICLGYTFILAAGNMDWGVHEWRECVGGIMKVWWKEKTGVLRWCAGACSVCSNVLVLVVPAVLYWC